MLAEFTLGKVRPQSITYPEAVRLFIEDKKRNRRLSTAEQYEWFLGRLKFGQLADIRPDDLSRQLAKVKSRSTYDHVLVAARIFFNWCMKRQYTSQNPTFGLSPHGTEKRARVLSDQELQCIWRACEGVTVQTPNPTLESAQENIGRLPAHFATIVKLLILTGARRGEIAALQNSWIDFQNSSLTFPASITKNGREHTIPLPATFAQLVTPTDLTTSPALIFPARGKANTPFNGWSKSKAALDKLSGVTGWTLHDLRRTYRSTLGRLGVRSDIAERLVNHISARSEMEITYDRYTYMPEMREAVAKYEAHLSRLFGAPQKSLAA
jgi:integrase